jgi:hypothetical protein
MMLERRKLGDVQALVALGVSLWDNKESADAYSRGPYAEVTKILANVVSGTPRVETYEVSNSTFHKIGAAAKA